MALPIRFRRRKDTLSNVDRLIAKWHDPDIAENFQIVPVLRNEFGNINSTGEPGNTHSWSLSRHQPQFPDCLEAGVRELVLLLVEGFDWITYSSCEGHQYRGKDIPSCGRYVSVLARSARERETIAKVFSNVVRAVNKKHARDPVRLKMRRSKVSSNAGRCQAILLMFGKPWRSEWGKYFSSLDSVYRSTLDAFEQDRTGQQK